MITSSCRTEVYLIDVVPSDCVLQLLRMFQMPCKVTDVCHCAAICKRLEIKVHQFPDAINGVISGWVRADKFVIERIVALAREHRSYAFAPYPLDRSQDPNLIVHQNVVLRGVAVLDVVQFVLLVDVNQCGAVESFMQSCSADLLWLENHVSIGKDHRVSELFDVVYSVHRIGEQSVGE